MRGVWSTFDSRFLLRDLETVVAVLARRQGQSATTPSVSRRRTAPPEWAMTSHRHQVSVICLAIASGHLVTRTTDVQAKEVLSANENGNLHRFGCDSGWRIAFWHGGICRIRQLDCRRKGLSGGFIAHHVSALAIHDVPASRKPTC